MSSQEEIDATDAQIEQLSETWPALRDRATKALDRELDAIETIYTCTRDRLPSHSREASTEDEPGVFDQTKGYILEMKEKIGAPGVRLREDEVRLMERAADDLVVVAAMNQAAKALIQFMEFIDARSQKDEVQSVENTVDETGTVVGMCLRSFGGLVQTVRWAGALFCSFVTFVWFLKRKYMG